MLHINWNSLGLVSSLLILMMWIGIPIPIAWTINALFTNAPNDITTEWLWVVPYWNYGIPVHLITEINSENNIDFGLSLGLLICIILLLFRSFVEFDYSLHFDLLIQIIQIGWFIAIISLKDQLGFGIIICGMVFLINSRVIFKKYQGINSQRRINRDPIRLQWSYQYLIIGTILILIGFPQQTGMLSWYYMKHNYLQFFLWGSIGDEGFIIFLNQFEINSLYFGFLWCLVVFSGGLMVNIGRPNVSFRHIKKSLKLMMVNIGFVIFNISLISLISKFENQPIILGPILYILFGMIGYFWYTYRIQFQIRQHAKTEKKEKNIENKLSENNEKDKLENEIEEKFIVSGEN